MTEQQAAQKDWLTRNEAAEYIGVKPDTLTRWATGTGITAGRVVPIPNIPRYRTAGRRFVYRRADLEKYKRMHPNGPWRPGKR